MRRAWVILALLVFLAGCGKTGPTGPTGPQGPQGDPGTNGTAVNSYITSDTTWAAANSPYLLTADLVIKYGVTLTIQPGTTVYFNPGVNFYVDGTLNAAGTAASHINFTNTANYVANALFYFSVSSGHSVLHYCAINDHFLSLATATVDIQNCFFYARAATSNTAYSGVMLSLDPVLQTAATVNFTNCRFQGALGYYLTASNVMGNLAFTNCIFSNWSGGITLANGSLTLQTCAFQSMDPSAMILHNEAGTLTVHNCDIAQGGTYIKNDYATADATGNWWGTTDLSSIAAKFQGSVNNSGNLTAAPTVTGCW